MPKLRFVVLATALVVPGCVGPDEPDTGQTVQSSDQQCSKTGCGNVNSPVIDGVYFWRLNSSFPGYLPNDEGVRITSVTDKFGAPMHLVALPDRLVGLIPGTNVILRQHAMLDGTTIEVLVGTRPYAITIEARTYYTVPLWVPPHSGIEAYKFYYTPLDVMVTTPKQPLCKSTLGKTQASLRAIVFTGDTYDPATKQVSTTAGTSWLNIACEDSAPWKMHLIGYTTAATSHGTGFNASPDQRQAMMNAWTMNACGTGRSFTVADTQLSLTPIPNVLPAYSDYQPDDDAREAVWGPTGALCLDVHRLATTAANNASYKATIAAECGAPLPSCASLGALPPNAHVLTGSPNWPFVALLPP